MKVQVLIATMHQRDYSLLEKMNIQTDAIVGNQTDENSVEEFEWKGNNIRWLSFNEKGVGLNRNNALMRADGDICLFADDDMVYYDDYINIVTEAFKDHPDADVIVFNIEEINPTRYIIKKTRKVWYHNYLRYGTARVAIRLKSIKEHGISFNLCFGGGTEHCHGEDNIFLTDCLKRKLKIYAVPKYIAKLTDERKSTWNEGYDRKYLVDQGILYRTISKRWWRLLCLQDAIKHHKEYNLSIIGVYKIMINGRIEMHENFVQK